ncbi:accessory gene regulator ArgB-like protein [Candidatus Contubernalis alkaliaceticus]|uniref:accessory gene regulator ArgB-like protein n=1 Tax=Candidatus Contubernalis alkaliaceticus TaxID=338645 RepID=UPI001F4C2292|nr:accessory gene regulator B family protein [Candidatus Contubernalis alkalaceticus]UNC93029.1 accessory gene regulator B family protein [Candidatus Contubernalis alkalaceticus]
MAKYLAQGTAEKIGQLAGLSPEDREVVAYGLDYLLSGIIGLTLMLAIGLALGFFSETLVIISCWTFIRIFAGGVHCTALWRCTVVNCLGITAAIFFTKGVYYFFPTIFWVGISVIWAISATWLWAPNNSEKPVNEPEMRRKLRLRALFMVTVISSLVIFASNITVEPWSSLAAAGATGLAAGGIMLSPIGFRLVKRLDQKLEKLSRF